MKPSDPQFDESIAQELIRKIREGNLAQLSGVDAKRFRAEHEDYIPLLSELERRRYLRKEQDRYWVTLLGLDLLKDARTEELFERFEYLFTILRGHYKANLEARLSVSDLSSLARLTYGEVAESLGYMLEINFWGSRSHTFQDPANAHVSLSEYVIRHKTFKEFVIEARREADKPVVPFEFSLSSELPGEYDQKSGILFSARQAEKDFSKLQAKLTLKNLPVALVYLDVDKFKDLNTRYTNKVVDDRILNDLQRHLVAISSDRGHAYRHGGDEFMIILPNHCVEEAEAFCERLRSSVESLRFTVSSEQVGVTVSLGIAVWPDHGTNYDEVLEHANEAQIVAKRTRNTVEVAKAKSSQREPLAGFGLSVSAQRVAVLLNERSETALPCDPLLEASTVLEALGIPAEEVALAADELAEREWVVLHKNMGMGAAGFSSISPSQRLFQATDLVLRGWNTEADARELAKLIATKGDHQAMGSAELSERTGWTPRRLNPATDFLVDGNFAKSAGQVSGVPYSHNTLFCSPRTRRFAAGS